MFFPERITSIKSTDKVLEIGPGSTPFHRSDVLLELRFDDVDTAIAQRGNLTEELKTHQKIVYYDGDKFPFEDNEFDYVICSHVLEHINDVDKFLSEMFRVAEKGYLEYPLIYFEYLYNIDVHLNILKFNKEINTIFYTKKNKEIESLSFLHEFISIGMSNGYLPDLYQYVIQQGVEGFEWSEPFKVKQTTDVSNLIHNSFILSPTVQPNRGLILKILIKMKKVLLF